MTPPNPVLRTWRETHGLTRPQMADALKQTPTAEKHLIWCHPTTIRKWETGHTHWPSPRYQAALRDLTGHTPTELGFTKPTPTPRRPPPRCPSTGPLTQDDTTLIDNLATLTSEHGHTWACWPCPDGTWHAAELQPWHTTGHLNLITATTADDLHTLLRTTPPHPHTPPPPPPRTTP